MARPTRRLGNVPSETTTFIGRRRELAELRTKLTTARLVSLVGPGGVGKTRIAIRVAAELGRGFRDGAWFVELAEVRDPGSVCDAAMAALDVRNQTATEPLAVVLSYLRDKELLLVLDNCEHVLDAAAQLVQGSIRIAPGVRVIATSRELLSVSGEYVIPPCGRVVEPAATERGGHAVHRASDGGDGPVRGDRGQQVAGR